MMSPVWWSIISLGGDGVGRRPNLWVVSEEGDDCERCGGATFGREPPVACCCSCEFCGATTCWLVVLIERLLSRSLSPSSSSSSSASVSSSLVGAASFTWRRAFDRSAAACSPLPQSIILLQEHTLVCGSSWRGRLLSFTVAQVETEKAAEGAAYARTVCCNLARERESEGRNAAAAAAVAAPLRTYTLASRDARRQPLRVTRKQRNSYKLQELAKVSERSVAAARAANYSRRAAEDSQCVFISKGRHHADGGGSVESRRPRSSSRAARAAHAAQSRAQSCCYSSFERAPPPTT